MKLIIERLCFFSINPNGSFLISRRTLVANRTFCLISCLCIFKAFCNNAKNICTLLTSIALHYHSKSWNLLCREWREARYLSKRSSCWILNNLIRIVCVGKVLISKRGSHIPENTSWTWRLKIGIYRLLRFHLFGTHLLYFYYCDVDRLGFGFIQWIIP
jgi:hypothetical protein